MRARTPATGILIGGFTPRQAGPQLRVARRVAPTCLSLYAPFFLAAMDAEEPAWDEDRLRLTLAEVRQDYVPHIEPESDLGVERREALRHHLDRAHTILANPDAAPGGPGPLHWPGEC